MEVIICATADEVAKTAGAALVEQIRQHPNTVLGLATGSSPEGAYEHLSAAVNAGEISLASVQAFTLDEYVGLPADHPQRYRNVILREVVAQTDLPAENLHSPDGFAADIAAACRSYEDRIAAAGGVDVQILGIGSDGHIAFNEPGSSLASRTRIKTLTRQTRQDNARFFNDDVDAVPTHCLTQGIGTIMAAGHLLLIATGRGKADAVHHLVEGPVSAMWPASALQWHPHVSVILDEAAASRLQLASYYREAYANKPSWQRL